MTVPLDPGAGDALAWLTNRIQRHFGDRFVGLYHYGSALYGDFVIGTSDLDLVCALDNDATDDDVHGLRRIHDELVQLWPEFTDRIEVQYASIHRVRTFREARFSIANISPGEPIHIIETGTEWMMNWYFAVHYSRTLAGPRPASIFPAIAELEFVQSARDHAAMWLDLSHRFATRKGQSYATLTLARALFTHRTGQHVSKEVAAAYLCSEFPEYNTMLDDALRWRIEPDLPAPDTEPRTATFVRRIAHLIAEETSGPSAASSR